MDQGIQNNIDRITKIEHGFRHLESEAFDLVQPRSLDECRNLAENLFKSKQYQVRCLAVFILGFIAANDPFALALLKVKVSRDPNWRVQEILAKAFDQYCKDVGYKSAMPAIVEWLKDVHPNVCRAVTEGLRIWTNRPYLSSNPDIAIRLIAQHKASDSEYLRKSVGNALRDISKKHSELIHNEISTWDISDSRIHYTYKLVSKKQKRIGN
jgi:3-methyladenine DNA glycosylase AlkD